MRHLILPLLACVTPAVGMPRVGMPPLMRTPISQPIATWLRTPEVSIYGGSALLLALVTNRLFTDTLLNSQSRADLIATVAPIVIILDALTAIDITPKEADTVPLIGQSVQWSEPSLLPQTTFELEWAADALTGEHTPCSSVALWASNRTLLLRGVVSNGAAARGEAGFASAVTPGPLLAKTAASRTGAPEYLPSLQILPGRVEFEYMAQGTQVQGEDESTLPLTLQTLRLHLRPRPLSNPLPAPDPSPLPPTPTPPRRSSCSLCRGWRGPSCWGQTRRAPSKEMISRGRAPSR